MKTQKVATLPPSKKPGGISTVTRECLLELNHMRAGDILRFPISENFPPSIQKKMQAKYVSALKTAAKLVGGKLQYRVAMRDADVYVEAY